MRTERKIGLKIRLFGGFEAECAGAPLPPLRSQKTRWLLSLLVLRHGHEVTRAWLAETLWPDSLKSEALASLRQCLSDLRRALGTEATRLQAPTSRTLRLDLENADVDLLVFDKLVTRTENESPAAAVAQYRGPLLPECSEIWIIQERETRLHKFLQAIQTLAARARADGDYDQALRLLRKGASEDPLSEPLCRTLMETLRHAGDFAAAVETFLALRRRLYDEFQMEPQPETSALYREIRAQARRKTVRVPAESNAAGPRFSAPLPLSNLIGREEELRGVVERLLTHRLVTLTGPGGAGKTRLALQAALELSADFPHGVVFVDLSDLTNPDFVPQAVAAALGVTIGAERVWTEALTVALQARSLLIILDNCEHLSAACAGLARVVLAACPGIRVLATSRRKLGLSGEIAVPLAGLILPDADSPLSPQGLLEKDAVRLFVERARAVNPSFSLTEQNAPAVVEICRCMDGLPLALELAAARTETLTGQEIASYLRDRLDLLRSESPTQPVRHRTLQAVMDWSHALLMPPEQALFRRLSVFAGGWTLEAAEAVCAGEPGKRPVAYRSASSDTPYLPSESVLTDLSHLAAHSLVSSRAIDGRTRYHLLETTRRYGREKLEKSGERTALQARHRAFYLALSERAAAHLTGPSQSEWLRALDAERENLRAALQPQDSSAEATRDALHLANALGRFWQIRGCFQEAREHFTRLLSQASSSDMRAERADALNWRSLSAAYQGDYAGARADAEEGLALWTSIGNASGMSGSLGCLGVIASGQGDQMEARERFAASLDYARQAGDRGRTAGALGYLGIVEQARGNFEEARRYFEAGLALRRELEDTWGVAASLNNLGLLAKHGNDPAQARRCLEQSLALRRTLGDRRAIAITLNILGAIACDEGNLQEARERLTEGIRLCREIGDQRSLAYAFEAFARLALQEGRPEGSARLFGAAAALRLRIGSPLAPSEQTDCDSTLQTLQQRLGEAACSAEYEAGVQQTLEQALHDALASDIPAGGHQPVADMAHLRPD